MYVIKLNTFRDDLTDISAKKEPLSAVLCRWRNDLQRRILTLAALDTGKPFKRLYALSVFSNMQAYLAVTGLRYLD